MRARLIVAGVLAALAALAVGCGTAAVLTAMMLADDIADIPNGAPSADDTSILVTAELDLVNYSQDNKLGSDVVQFTSDEQSYNPDGPVDARPTANRRSATSWPCRRTARSPWPKA